MSCQLHTHTNNIMVIFEHFDRTTFLILDYPFFFRHLFHVRNCDDVHAANLPEPASGHPCERLHHIRSAGGGDPGRNVWSPNWHCALLEPFHSAASLHLRDAQRAGIFHGMLEPRLRHPIQSVGDLHTAGSILLLTNPTCLPQADGPAHSW
jgi:hypothetical protein